MHKFLLVSVLLMAAAFTSSAQTSKSFFAPLPKLHLERATLAIDSSNLTMNAWRPIASIVAYSEPGNILMAGVGGGYQHLKWNTTSQAWSCVWSINALAFAGGSVAPSTPASVMSVGAMVGIDNNLIMAGPVYNFGTKQFGIGLSVAINFNNGIGL